MTTAQKLIYNKCITELNLTTARLSDEYYYDSLPQCIIDAVYSIQANYTATRNTVIRYCDATNTQRISAPLGTCSDSHTINQLLTNIYPHIDDDFGATNLFVNHQFTSTKNGILKAEAVYRFATVLADNGIQTLNDVRTASIATIDAIEYDIKTIPGQKSGISFSYFLMLSGDDHHMKIDRWLLRFVGDALGVANYHNVSQAYTDLLVVCSELTRTYPNLTPRLLDHTIWNYMRSILQ
jgi:hypothetical protein